MRQWKPEGGIFEGGRTRRAYGDKGKRICSSHEGRLPLAGQPVSAEVRHVQTGAFHSQFSFTNFNVFQIFFFSFTSCLLQASAT